MGKGEAIVAIARAKLGKVKAKQPSGGEGGKELRYGSDVLLEIFKLSAPGVWSDDVIKYLGPGLPSWCGIFATYCIKKAGINIGDWQMGKGVSAYGTLKQTATPQPGDIGYIDQPFQHHCIVSKVDGEMIESIDGNSGLFSEIIENKRPRKAFTGFFTALQNAPAPEVQRREKEDGGREAQGDIESDLRSSRGQGTPMDDRTRGEMENGFGRDFSDVRVHTDGQATRMSNDLNAQAFTHGRDIYFNEGRYNPDTSSGRHLLAHELTHTVQQQEGVQTLLQKDDNPQTNVEGAKEPIDFDKSVITLPKISLPKAKDRGENPKLATPFVYPKGYERKNSYKDVDDESSAKEQREVWTTGVKSGVEKKVTDLKKAAEDANAYDPKSQALYLKQDKGNLLLVGKAESISENAFIPTWSRGGKATAFDVDHVRELQLGGKNFHTNMELLHFSLNRGSGNSVKNEINSRLISFIEKENKENKDAYTGKNFPANSKAAKENFSIVFKTLDFAAAPTASGKDHYWTLEEISAGKHLENFKPMKSKDIEKVKGMKDDETIYTSAVGGSALKTADILALNDTNRKITFGKPTFIADQTGKKAGEKVGSFPVEFGFYGSNETRKKFSVPVLQMDGVLHGGSIPRRGQNGSGGLEQILVGLDLQGMSPVTVDDAQFLKGKGLAVRGRIHPTLDVLKGIDLDFFMEGEEFGISKTITAEKFKLPAPFKINEALLTIGAGNKGVFVQGDVLFEISKLGTGKISGLGKSNGDFGIKGKFDFDPKLFRKGAAAIEVEYNNKDGWSAKGELQIGKGAVKGIDSAKISVAYASNVLEASGTAQVALKGVEEVTLRIKFAEETSEIEGGVKIGKLPGIKEGAGKLSVVNKGDNYDFSGKGKITPDIPGLDTQVDFEFHNDIFLVDARVAYEKGRLKGKLNVGITNRAVDAEGKPTGDALPDYKVFGKSDLELRITDKLLVNAGVTLLENGEIEVKGGIKLPDKFEVVPKLYSVENKPLVTIPSIHIPLFGIPLGVATIGIEAVITPTLEATVKIGPGSLTKVGAEITYNPAHPDDMSITGAADFEFIAEAGISAGVDFGLAASAAVASLTGGINLSAFIKAAAKQPVFHTDVKYSPKTGFELNGLVDAKVAAILGFSGDLFVKASAGVAPLEISKTWKWPLFNKEIDTGVQIGFEFPFSYKDGKADVSFENLKFSYPSMKDITKKVREEIVDPLASKF
ncbi:MAG: DUF4157 domain-containing protein [Chlorobiaceae bacterium]|nr:DUF4157 domain-containing protein [Chlorobiaceae bacterium]